MHAVERRPAVLNPSLGRTSSAFEAVEMRRKLARKTNRLQAQAPEAMRQPRPTAQLYAHEGPTLDGESSKRNRVNRLLAGVFFSAVALMTIVVVGGLG